MDEYQDINAAQDKIIEGLSREEASQPLPRRRCQAEHLPISVGEPPYFHELRQMWRDAQGQVIPLVDNFRSREQILQFVNSFFGSVMQPEAGGLQYDEQARLRFGAPEARSALSACPELRSKRRTPFTD